MRIPVLALALLSAPILAQDPAPVDSAMPKVGAMAPTFRLNDHEGRAVDVGGTAKAWTVLAFYPKAATPG